MKKTIALAAFAVAAATSFAGSANMTAAVAQGRGDLLDVAASKGQFKTLIKLVKQAGLADML
ncbi:hypothetical protein EON79_20600, partial [bacterium]